MSFLSSETLGQRLTDVVDPFRPDRIKHAAYELSLGNEVALSGSSVKKLLGPRSQISIPPGQFALLITEEVVKIPNNLIALISIKFTIKKMGLVNVSGFHVDPGFEGRLKFSVYNAGTAGIPLTVGEPLFLIWFLRLDQTTQNPYPSDRNKWLNISETDIREIQGRLASPEALRKDLDRVQIYGKIILAIATPLFVAAMIQSGIYFWNQFRQPPKSEVYIVRPGLEKSLLDSRDNAVTVADSVVIYQSGTNSGSRDSSETTPREPNNGTQ